MDTKKYNNKNLIVLITVVGFFCLNLLPFLSTVRPVMYDESWYASVGYEFLQGHGFTNKIVGSGGNANFLFPMLTAVFFKLFGISLFSARFLSVCFGIGTIIMVHFIFNELRIGLKNRIVVFALFLSLTLFNSIFRFARPESASLMFCALGILYFIRYINFHKLTDMLFLSLAVICATLSHPYSLLLFALFGVYLLVESFKNRSYKYLFRLTVLLFAACCSVYLLYFVSDMYNGENSCLTERLYWSNLTEAVSVYLKTFFFSKYAIFVYVLFPFLFFGFKSDIAGVKILSVITFAFFVLFPFLFSADIMMIGLGLDYVMLLMLIIIGGVLEYSSLKIFKRHEFFIGLYFFCAMNYGITLYYNYSKYEDVNTSMENDISKIIPKNAVVFGPIRQWFCAMETNYYSDHYRLSLPSCDNFDYLIYNSIDSAIYNNYRHFDGCFSDFELIYSKRTKAYGVVNVYKNIR